MLAFLINIGVTCYSNDSYALEAQTLKRWAGIGN